MKILIIEDERSLSDSIVAYLSSEKYLCEQAFTYDDAKMKVNLYEYDCVLLDLMLPGGNGLDILRDIRKQRNPVGVIIFPVLLPFFFYFYKVISHLNCPFHINEVIIYQNSLIFKKIFNIVKVLYL